MQASPCCGYRRNQPCSPKCNSTNTNGSNIILYFLLALLSVRTSLASFTFGELWTLQIALWEIFLYPANVEQINATDTPVSAEDVQGRVDITRTFDGRELNNVYIFRLFSDPDHPGLVGVPIAYNITQFASNENIGSATTVALFNATSFNAVVHVTIDTWILYNTDDKISQYDATFRWFNWLFDTLLEAAGGLFNTTDPVEIQSELGGLLASTICQTHDDYCQDDNQQYESTDECVTFLTEEIRFGKPYQLGRNTLLCREVHEHMAQYRPIEHCPHIGPTGGWYCVRGKSYEDVVTESYFRECLFRMGMTTCGLHEPDI